MSHITTVTHHDSRGSGGSPASRRRLRHIGAMLAGSIVVAALLLVLANLAFAQSAQKKASPDLKPFLVEDIYPGATGSEPSNLVNFKGRLLFGANHPNFGEELWKSDGTERGTKIVKDIVPGPGSSGAEDFVTIAPRTTLFRAWDAAHGEELWKTDGTERGTTLIKDINLDSPPG